jgi:coenzyme F420-reducing hydrogenase delta subunit
MEGKRVKMINISSAMGNQFAVSAQEMSEQIVNLGPNPLRELDDDD